MYDWVYNMQYISCNIFINIGTKELVGAELYWAKEMTPNINSAR